MQRSSKSIVVKQWGAAGAGRLPTSDVNSAGAEQGAPGLASSERARAVPSLPRR